jgi:ferredoxin
MKVRIDTDLCTGHGRCYALVPELFDTDDRGYGVVTVSSDLSPEQVALAHKAAGNCPEQAIVVE